MKIGKKIFFFKKSEKNLVSSKMEQNPSSCSIGIWNYHLAPSKSKSRIFPGPYASPLCDLCLAYVWKAEKAERVVHNHWNVGIQIIDFFLNCFNVCFFHVDAIYMNIIILKIQNKQIVYIKIIKICFYYSFDWFKIIMWFMQCSKISLVFYPVCFGFY